MTRSAALLPFLLPALAIAGCSKSTLHPPSLLPRPAEVIDPRLPVDRPLVQTPGEAGLRARVAELVREARAGDAAFEAALGAAERAAASAGGAQSEGWIAAQEALSALEAARAPTTHALSDLDALAGERIQRLADLGASDRAMIDEAATSVRGMEERQSARIKALNGRLGR